MEIDEIFEFANFLGDEAAKVTLSAYGKNIEVENKSSKSFDPVTIADKKTETLIRKLIKDKYPNHGVIGEEFKSDEFNDKPYWVIDPIDGTRAYILEIPVWGTLIAFNDGENPVIGICDQPFLKDRYLGFKKKSFKVSGGEKNQIFTSEKDDLSSCTVSTTDPNLFSEKDFISFNNISTLCSTRRFGLDCMGYCLLASGKIDLIIEPDLKTYDIQALIPIIEGAGGMITTWEGKDPSNGGNIIASCSKSLHEEVLLLLGG